jgi:hypothetical protein
VLLLSFSYSRTLSRTDATRRRRRRPPRPVTPPETRPQPPVLPPNRNWIDGNMRLPNGQWTVIQVPVDDLPVLDDGHLPFRMGIYGYVILNAPPDGPPQRFPRATAQEIAIAIRNAL